MLLKYIKEWQLKISALTKIASGNFYVKNKYCLLSILLWVHIRVCTISGFFHLEL